MDFRERKAARKEYYEKYLKGWKLHTCGACSGSGYYDHNGSPPCGNCEGNGKERCPPTSEENKMSNYTIRGLKYVMNTNGGATKAHFIEDFEPIGERLWDELSTLFEYVKEDENGRIRLTEKGAKVLGEAG